MLNFNVTKTEKATRTTLLQQVKGVMTDGFLSVAKKGVLAAFSCVSARLQQDDSFSISEGQLFGYALYLFLTGSFLPLGNLTGNPYVYPEYHIGTAIGCPKWTSSPPVRSLVEWPWHRAG